MPIYTYECTKCNHTEDHLVKNSERDNQNYHCPNLHEPEHQHPQFITLVRKGLYSTASFGFANAAGTTHGGSVR